MQTIREHSLAIAAILALVPAMISWLAGRSLAKDLDDRSLPERLLSHQRRTSETMGVAAGTIGMIAPGALIWAAPLLFTTLLLAGYPLRRALFEETWPVGRSVEVCGGVVVAIGSRGEGEPRIWAADRGAG